jgi:uncharacterized protein YndB with AHSA1/START domain
MENNVEPVRHQITVDATPDRAFRVFTDQARWWPRDKHIGKTDPQTIVLEPRAGGRWYERGTDGAECDWGKVLVWDPPRRLVLAWQISGAWQYDPSLVTEVEVKFTPAGSGRTRVELEHRNLDRYGANAEAVRNAISSPGGWPGIMADFAAAVTRQADSAARPAAEAV